MLRAVRMAARFGLDIDPATGDAIRDMAPQLADGVSAERIADELRKMLVDPHRARAMRLLAGPRPRRRRAARAGAGGRLRSSNGSPDPVGVPASRSRPCSPTTGRRTAGEIALRLKLSTEERERIEWLVENRRTLADCAAMRPARLKPLLVHPGIDDLMALHRAIGDDPDAADYAVAIRAAVGRGGRTEPAAAADRQRPARDGPAAGADVQDRCSSASAMPSSTARSARASRPSRLIQEVLAFAVPPRDGELIDKSATSLTMTFRKLK